MPSVPHVPISWGELIDKITILQIKAAKLAEEKRARVAAELSQLQAIAAPALDEAVRGLAARLGELNAKLWDIEDRIRAKEAAKSFDAEFVELARAIYHTNDERGAVKRQINLHLQSPLMEEKIHPAYR